MPPFSGGFEKKGKNGDTLLAGKDTFFGLSNSFLETTIP